MTDVFKSLYLGNDTFWTCNSTLEHQLNRIRYPEFHFDGSRFVLCIDCCNHGDQTFIRASPWTPTPDWCWAGRACSNPVGSDNLLYWIKRPNKRTCTTILAWYLHPQDDRPEPLSLPFPNRVCTFFSGFVENPIRNTNMRERIRAIRLLR